MLGQEASHDFTVMGDKLLLLHTWNYKIAIAKLIHVSVYYLSVKVVSMLKDAAMDEDVMELREAAEM